LADAITFGGLDGNSSSSNASARIAKGLLSSIGCAPNITTSMSLNSEKTINKPGKLDS
jgi:hypothetical protein